ncbi:MAG: AEC family transporter [Clostridia bacterium]|nr:AEC family transporter [Clostridia bacterium]
MKSFIFAFNSVSPIIFTVAIGYLLKRLGLMNGDFSKQANKLVFRVFLPVMLFRNVYGIENIGTVDFGYVLYSLIALLIIFAIAVPSVTVLTDKKRCRGALLQGVFRSNYALIGIPLASSLFPGEGAAVATLLSAFMVPAFNILAVIGLSIFNNDGEKPDFKKVLTGILKNPLILGIVSGLVALGIRSIFVNFGISFRLSEIPAVWNTLEYLSRIATPLALLVLGAQFEFSAIPHLKREIITGTIIRSIIVPLLGIGIAYFAFRDSFGGAQFAALVAVFCTPVAVSSVPMAQEMGTDAELAGQLVVFTTLSSAFTVFLASFILKSVGIF